MKHTKDEIINALKVIKEECGRCCSCPFCLDGACMIIRKPSDWDIADPEPEIWRAFKS